MAEEWNSRSQRVVGKHHPSSYAFFEELKAEHEDTEAMFEKLDMGRPV